MERERERKEVQERAQREAYRNRIVGTYLFCGEYNKHRYTMIITSPTHANHHSKYPERTTEVYSEYKVGFDGSKVVTLNETANPEKYRLCKSFIGEINKSGTVISGNYIQDDGEYNGTVTYYKVG